MIITKPEKTEDLYPLFKQILIENHKPDKAASWGVVTFTGKGFYLKLNGDYRYDYIRKTVDIEHPDEYFLKKFHIYNEYSETLYLDRFITMRFCRDMKGRKGEWVTNIYQHQNAL
jgi:hypothetical protein